MNTKRFRIVAAAILVFVFMMGCGTYGQTTTRGTAVREIRMIEGTQIKSLNPYKGITACEDNLRWLIFDMLVKMNYETGRVEPMLAERWEVKPDGLTWVFYLKKGVRFSDGTPFNAESVKFSLDTMIDPNYGHVMAAQYSLIEKTTIIDDYTVEVKTKTPFAALVLNLSKVNAAMVGPRSFKALGDDFAFKPVGTGPYKVKTFTPELVVLERNPYYSGPETWADEISYRVVPEAGARVAALEAGDADVVVKIPPEFVKRLNQRTDLKVIPFPSLYHISLEINNLKKPYSDVRVRHALNYAIDRKALVAAVLGGFGEEAKSCYARGNEYWVEMEPWEYNPKKAKQLLAEAGYPNGFTAKLWVPHGRYLKDAEIGEVVHKYLTDIGIDVRLEVWEWSPYVDKSLQLARADDEKEIFMVGRATIGADYTLTRLFHSASNGNVTGYANSRVDALLEKASRTFDVKEAAKLYEEAQRIIFKEDAPWIFLHSQQQIIGVREGVKGVYATPDEYLRLREASK